MIVEFEALKAELVRLNKKMWGMDTMHDAVKAANMRCVLQSVSHVGLHCSNHIHIHIHVVIWLVCAIVSDKPCLHTMHT
jgi:hypothetical protein